MEQLLPSLREDPAKEVAFVPMEALERETRENVFGLLRTLTDIVLGKTCGCTYSLG